MKIEEIFIDGLCRVLTTDLLLFLSGYARFILGEVVSHPRRPRLPHSGCKGKMSGFLVARSDFIWGRLSLGGAITYGP